MDKGYPSKKKNCLKVNFGNNMKLSDLECFDNSNTTCRLHEYKSDLFLGYILGLYGNI